MKPTTVFAAQLGLYSTERMRKGAASIALLLWLVPTCFGQGTMQIGFEGPAYPGAPSPQPPGTYSIISGYIESGVWFRNPQGPETLALTGPASSGYADDGTAWLYTSLGATLAFSLTNGTPFSLLSFALADAYTNNLYPIALQMVGYRYDGGVVSNSLTIGSLVGRRAAELPDFETFLLGSGFADLTRVEISGGRFALDNVLLWVPEPSLASLVVLGGVCLLAWRRWSSRRPR